MPSEKHPWPIAIKTVSADNLEKSGLNRNSIPILKSPNMAALITRMIKIRVRPGIKILILFSRPAFKPLDIITAVIAMIRACQSNTIGSEANRLSNICADC